MKNKDAKKIRKYFEKDGIKDNEMENIITNTTDFEHANSVVLAFITIKQKLTIGEPLRGEEQDMYKIITEKEKDE